MSAVGIYSPSPKTPPKPDGWDKFAALVIAAVPVAQWALIVAMLCLTVAVGVLAAKVNREHEITQSTNNEFKEISTRITRVLTILEDEGTKR